MALPRMIRLRVDWRYIIASAIALSLLGTQATNGQDGSSDDDFQYSPGPVPQTFSLHARYPDRNETVECRPIRLRVERDSRLYRDSLVLNTNPGIVFATSDARRMSSRVQTRLNDLATRYYEEFSVTFTVLKAWTEYPDSDVDDDTSLHYEGRTVRVQVAVAHTSALLRLAIEVGFDWVFYASQDYVRLSVIPDLCNVAIDLVFMLDQSGSVGRYNHDIALGFIQDVVSFFEISENNTQVGLITFSSGATVEFDLDDHQTLYSLSLALQQVYYRGGWTTTAYALFLAREMLDPSLGYGVRPTEDGIPRVAVLITDGRSNVFPIHSIASDLRDSGVQVYTVGIGNVFLNELRFIASDPDEDHVFRLDSYSDASSFVDFLSFTTCDAPAIVPPGNSTTTDVAQDDFRYFQTECPAFSVTIMIEQIDLIGACSLYASYSVQNPGPLSPYGSVVRNEDHSSDKRSVILSLPHQAIHRFVYVSVRGVEIHNTFSVIIWDMIFEEEMYTIYVPEGVGNFDVFSLNDALRETNVTFDYSITDGDDYNFFDIDQSNGVLYLTTALSADHASGYFLLTIVAQNSLYSCHRGRVIIKVIIIRDRIEFPELEPVSIPENSAIGSNVTTVQTTSNDGSVVYSIIDGNLGNAFAISETTGDITVAAELDFETLDSYNLVIRGQSTVTNNTGTVEQVIRVSDVNETPFFITACAVTDSCTFAVAENQPNLTDIGGLQAGDPDLASVANGMIEFSILPDSVPFQAKQLGENVVIETTQVLDRENANQSSFTFEVVVSDRGSPLLSATTVVMVTVLDEDDNPPVFVQSPDVIQIPESTPEMIIDIFTAVDLQDIGSNAEVVYSVANKLPGQPPLPFEIDASTGILRLNDSLDHEEVQNYFIVVTASNPVLSTTIEALIVVTDDNDNRPIFSADEYFGEVFEHSSPETAIATVEASDLDTGNNGAIVFSIESGNFENLLQINSISGEIGLISVLGDIDREVIQEFNLIVVAHDLGDPQMSSSASVRVVVLDINDNPPVFTLVNDTASIPEDSAPFEILTVVAFDVDEPDSPNSQIEFEILSGNIGEVFELTMLESNNATLSLIGQLDFETQPNYELTIIARDLGNPEMNGTATITIDVININEFPPSVSGNQTIEVSEREVVGRRIARVNASDIDNNNITFAIVMVTGDQVTGTLGMDVFGIDDEGFVILNEGLDFETTQRFIITIEVTDGQLTSITTLTVLVIDENEGLPMFVGPTFFQTMEEQPSGTVVGQVEAVDIDTGPNAVITYSIVGDGSLFDINSTTGEIRTLQVLNREELIDRELFLPSDDSSVEIMVQARDSGTPSFISIATVTIQLLDINDNAPRFSQLADGFSASISENAPIGMVIPSIDAMATDLDLGVNSLLTYSLEVLDQSDTPFTINSTTGVVMTTAALDRESQDMYNISITVSDGGSPSLFAMVTGSISVLDENDNAPYFVQNITEVSILENVISNPLVSVSAFDADLGQNSVVMYSIQPNPPDTDAFVIDPNTGVVSLISGLDFEAQPRHELIVVATDLGSPIQQSSSAVVIVTVINVDESPPIFTEPCGVVVMESVDVDLPIAQCIAQDFDDVTNTSTIAMTHVIVSGNLDDTFELTNDGTLIVRRPLDRETVSSYFLGIRATDVSGLIRNTILIVTVDDVNDNTPQFTNVPASITITMAMIDARQTEVFTLEATDDDIDENAELRYSIESTNQRVDGLETTLSVAVRDLGDPSLSSSSSVTFTFENSCASQQFTVDAITGVITARLLCSIDIQPRVATVSIGNSLQLLCPVTRNIEASFQFLQNGSFATGEMPLGINEMAADLTISNVMFQDAGEYSCRVTTAIGSLQSPNAIVSVQDPPYIDFPPADISVFEGQAVQFSCFARGVPDPVITWARQTPQGEVIVQRTLRVVPFRNFLAFSSVQDGDQGQYTCIASNAAGEARATATLNIIGLSSVVNVDIMDFTSPRIDNSCHEIDTSAFEATMAGITAMVATVVDRSGPNLCEQTACSPSPCQNGGSCDLNPNGRGGYVCSCSTGFTGVDCEEDIDECNENPCQFGGSCTNTVGSFACACRDGYQGHRCQYSTVCETQMPCHDNQTCIATVANIEGYVCEEVRASGSVVVGGSTQGAMLDEAVSTLLEEEDAAVTKRRRRQTGVANDDNFVTTCEARFIPSPQLPQTMENQFILVWACPNGLSPPSTDTLDLICQNLFETGLVSSCESPSGQSFKESGETVPLDPVNITLSFVLINAEGRVLTNREALAVLSEVNALEQLRRLGYQATRFTTAVPIVQPAAAAPTEIIIGVVISGVMLAMVIVLIIAIVCVARQRHIKKNHRRRKQDSHENSIYSSSSQKEKRDVNSSEQLFDNAIYSKGYQPPPVSGSPKFKPPSNRGPDLEPPTDENPPPKRVRSRNMDYEYWTPRKMAGAENSYQKPTHANLERAASLLKAKTSSSLQRRTESSAHLLDTEYDDIIITPSTSSSSSTNEINAGYDNIVPPLATNHNGDDYDDITIPPKVPNQKDDDYDDIIMPPKPSNQNQALPSVPPTSAKLKPVNSQQSEGYHDDDESIYGNSKHEKLGAHGNAGERWESYWKSDTLLRGSSQQSPQQSPKK